MWCCFITSSTIRIVIQLKFKRSTANEVENIILCMVMRSIFKLRNSRESVFSTSRFALWQTAKASQTFGNTALYRFSHTNSQDSIQQNNIVKLDAHTIKTLNRTSVFYRQHCSQRKPPVFNLLRGRFWGFSPRRGDTLHRLGWNLAWRRGPKCGI